MTKKVSKKSKSEKCLLSVIDQARILQLSNDLSEGIASGTVREWRTVAEFFRQEHDTLYSRLQSMHSTLAALELGERMRNTALEEVSEWLRSFKNIT
jgi:hypothetical protein